MLRNLRIPFWTVPIILLFIIVIAFGLLIPDLGFYWDDWAKTLVDKVFGPSGYWEYYAEDRPLSGWTHIVFNAVLGDRPVNWHIFTLILRWISSVGLFICMLAIWPNKKMQAVYSAILFSLYPVFTLQAIPVTFHQQWLQYVLYFISIGFMIYAIKKPERKIVYSILSIIFLVLQLSITEYFAPLEFLRPFILWLLIDKNKCKTIIQKFVKVFKEWIPYLILIIGYLVWRLFLIDLTGDDPYRPDVLYNLFSQPISTLSQLFETVIKDTLYVILANWSNIIDLGLFENNTRFVLYTWGLGLLSGLITVAYLLLIRDQSQDQEINNNINHKEEHKWFLEAGIIGLVALLLGCVPAWISGREVIFDYHSNRYAMAAMFGASILFVVFIEWISKNYIQKAVLIGILVSLSVGYHLRIGDEHREIWSNQIDFYWQLSWRAPYIEPSTAIITEEELFPNQGLFSTSSAINLLYPQPDNMEHLAYWVYSLRPRYTNITDEPLEMHFSTQFRTLTYLGDTPDSLMVYYYPGRSNCMWLISEDDQYNPYLPELTKETYYLSNLSQIVEAPVENGYPAESMFGNEPEHDWCFYYQKSDLARQFNDWNQIVEYAKNIEKMGYTPNISGSNYVNEWTPYIEGYAHMNLWDEAEQITNDCFKENPEANLLLCHVWERIEKEVSNSVDKKNSIQYINELLNCN